MHTNTRTWLLVVAAAALLIGGARPAAAQGVPQPTPRPTLEPSDPSGGRARTPDTGHITGTVIDERTGAPAAGVPVQVGADIVLTDGDGNYDHWLMAGTYPVTLLLDDSVGVALQPVAMVAIAERGRSVQHLMFRSPVPAKAIETAPTAPAAAPDAAVAEPDPLTLTPVAAMPTMLPHTGEDGDGALVWISLAMLIALGGLGIAGMPLVRLAPLIIRRQEQERSAPFDRAALLTRLLAPRRRDADLLEDLLRQRDGD